MIDQARAFGPTPPLLVLTGGDRMRRPDLAEQAENLVDIYRANPMFTTLRNPDALTGRCGRCRHVIAETELRHGCGERGA